MEARESEIRRLRRERRDLAESVASAARLGLEVYADLKRQYERVSEDLWHLVKREGE